ncbi:hypothetical protein [Pseudoalteromonas luteoviolacea]|uniref:Solute-binding protein family 3/N-terminal domain-containing protein n=1 Tax=Pseudoalteromonas luteoviolacea S4054 TaxID=1129367 RepID=A0A0F6AAY1_9GAMM|nr:hypothetical protein [Pseudoalteromonas luteoviolacea]AOT06834.1 hypothetical protein S4054249_02620 [Pseudoalteromonas luteoviolacea]AOT11752.1 hypothetical protein S40542_02620 [Pseudoalteromonas luteoviolacea]AOT16664.1 hypothetical protein S4054_02620 [Pseudoalteromonas luteoviolacea]KKE83325.1 hypothetical protein N479_14375 [Pseudoalteromonas luteoviolacea S4054]KZN74058.1 hypothetical protein N481_10110 [Pseudoalteromonas luteoviolacea S4047-1]
MYKLILIWLLLVSYASIATETIRVRGSQSEHDSTHNYYVGLIELAFDKLKKPIQIQFSPYMVQDRALFELQSNRLIDLYWAGTNQQRESELGVVPIPLIKGLLGYRVFTIHQDNEQLFSQIKSIKSLKNMTLCQGQHWPDTDIMLAAGLSVITNVVYENMFKQVYADRCKAFPRGINEAFSEVESRQKIMPKLMVFDEVILHYRFPMYFFTHKDNTQLINDLQSGLMLAIKDGSFDKYMQTHPTTQHLFPLSKWDNKTILTIDNPFLSQSTPVDDKALWIELGKKQSR